MSVILKEEIRLKEIENNPTLSLQSKIAMYLCGDMVCDFHMSQAQYILDIIEKHQKDKTE